MTALRIVSVAVVATIALTSAAWAGTRVAQLEGVAGDVIITRIEDGRIDKPTLRGTRVRDGSVFAGDVISTGAGATASMLFTDGSQVAIQASTSLTVNEVDRSALVAQGKTDKPIGRVIKVIAGKILSEVVANPKLATEFETPSGVAAVKGTVVAVAVSSSGQVTLKTEHGTVEFTVHGVGSVVVLPGGFAIEVTTLPTGEIRLVAASGNPGPLQMRLGNSVVELAPGTEVAMTSQPDAIALVVKQGTAVVVGADGSRSTAGPGTSFRAERAAESPDATGGPRVSTITVVEGSVEYTVPGVDGTVTVGAGYSVVVTESANGHIELAAPASNPGPLTVTIGGLTAELAPGTDVGLTNSGGQVVLEVGRGSVTTIDASGQRQPLGPGGRVETAALVQSLQGIATVAVTEGEIVYSVPGANANVTVVGGNAVVVSETPAGGFDLHAPSTNGSSLTVEFGDLTGTLQPGTRIGLILEGGEIRLTVIEGTVTVVDANGNSVTYGPGDQTSTPATAGSGSVLISGGPKTDGKKPDGKKPGGKPGGPTGDDDDDDDEELAPLPRACGECSVPDGVGGCVDVDQLCPDESCRVDRQCRNGACVGGRQLTSRDDPRCAP